MKMEHPVWQRLKIMIAICNGLFSNNFNLNAENSVNICVRGSCGYSLLNMSNLS
jgi:hypothetical protein